MSNYTVSIRITHKYITYTFHHLFIIYVPKLLSICNIVLDLQIMLPQRFNEGIFGVCYSYKSSRILWLIIMTLKYSLRWRVVLSSFLIIVFIRHQNLSDWIEIYVFGVFSFFLSLTWDCNLQSQKERKYNYLTNINDISKEKIKQGKMQETTKSKEE